MVLLLICITETLKTSIIIIIIIIIIFIKVEYKKKQMKDVIDQDDTLSLGWRQRVSLAGLVPNYSISCSSALCPELTI